MICQFISIYTFSVWIGVKKLLTLVEMAKQSDESQRVNKFLILLEEEQAIEPYL